MNTQICMTMLQLKQYEKLNHKLKEVFEKLVDMWPVGRMYITSIYRNDPNSVHGYYRGIDIGIKNLGYNHQYTAETLADEINNHWKYDPDRPDKPVAYAKPHGDGPHIHLQVHPNTTRH